MTRIITDDLDRAALAHPDKVAFGDSARELTYAALRDEAYHVAAGIVELGVFRSPVAVFLDKSVECISCFFGIAYSGNFYTMIDTEMPLSRMEKITATLEPKVIVTDRGHKESAQAVANGARVLLFEELMAAPFDEAKIRAATSGVIESDVLYVLFTSGSTGIPKGVITSHRALITYIDAASDRYHITEKTVIGNQTPFYFVMSVIDIYCTVHNGGSAYIIPREFFTFPGQLVRCLEQHHVTMLNWVPSALCVVANLRAFGKADLSALETVVFGGEVMPIKQLNAWIDALPDATFFNAYGSTEITDTVTVYRVDRRFAENEVLPLGKPLYNTAILVLNDKDELAAEGEIGELCVRGNNLAYGYYNNPERTRAVFVQNPLNDKYPETVYRMGDLVRYNKYGELEFVGRKDFQIKHMGHRIELGEIEANISAVEGVLENCCVYDSEHQRIVLFYTGEIDSEVLGEKLKQLVPAYMLPNKRVHLGKMPHNLNGKIDRAELKRQA